MIPLILFVLNLVLGAWGLPLATGMARAWTRLYTRFVPKEQRERRLQEIESDLFEQTESDQRMGYRPSEIALRIMLRVLSGVADDITWAGGRVRVFEGWSRRDQVQASVAGVILVWNAAGFALVLTNPSPAAETLRVFDIVVPSTTLRLVALVLSGLGATVQVLLLLQIPLHVGHKRAQMALDSVLDDWLRIGVPQALAEPELMSRLEAAAADSRLPRDTRTALARVLHHARISSGRHLKGRHVNVRVARRILTGRHLSHLAGPTLASQSS